MPTQGSRRGPAPRPEHGRTTESTERRRELRDKADVQALIRARPDLDWAKVQEYAEMLGEWPAIERIREQG